MKVINALGPDSTELLLCFSAEGRTIFSIVDAPAVTHNAAQVSA